MASSEDDKVPPTPSTLESVTEKAEAEVAEDRTSDKLSDEGLGTSEVDKTEEEKLNEVSDASNEDLASGLIEPTKNIISQDSTETKPEDGQAEEIPAEPVLSQPEESVTDGQQTVEELTETQEKTKDESPQVLEVEKEPEEVAEEEEKETGTEESESNQQLTESRESEEKLEDTPEKPESISEVVRAGEKEEEDKDTISDMANGTDVDMDKDNIESSPESNVMDANLDGDTETKSSVDDSSAEVLVEKEVAESQPGGATEEKPDEKVPEEAEQPEQENEAREIELEEQAPSESTNGVSDEAKDTSEDSEQVLPSKDVPVKEDEEKTTSADESTSQNSVCVPESETDSETKTEQGSPAVIKPDVEKDSDSGSSSAADSNSLDLNLSISSFLSKSKEGGSISLQVIQPVPHL